MIDWNQVRREFPALENWTYLNTATYGQLPRKGVEAINRYMARHDEFAASDFLDWYDDVERIRGKIAQLIHATADDIAFCPNAATALSWLMHGIKWQPGDRILTLEQEFPNNLYAPWFAEGVEFDEVPWERFYDSITPRTRLVLLSMLNYASGFRPPLEEISAKLRERGVLLFVDGTQGLGPLQFDINAVQPSMFAVHGYKWMLSPTGAGFCYVAPEIRKVVPPMIVGWRSHHGWRDVDNLHHGKPEFSGRADQYEGGGLPFTLLFAMEASVELMLEIGPREIEGRVLGLADGVREILRENGGIVADGATPIVAGRFDRRDVSAIARQLRKRHVLVSARHGFLRVSPHLYNNEEDLERFREELRHAIG